MNRAARFDPLAQKRRIREFWSRRLRGFEALLILSALAYLIYQFGVHRDSAHVHWTLDVAILSSLSLLAVSLFVRGIIAPDRSEFLTENRNEFILFALWIVGLFAIVLTGLGLDSSSVPATRQQSWMVIWSEIMLMVQGIEVFLEMTRRVAAVGWSPAVLLVGSFVLLIAAGTMLLMLPICRNPNAEPPPQITPFMAALYTSTSACCVTGLVIVDTGVYWSRIGQTCIMLLIQVGGLGIMTFGGLFSLVSGRAMQVREGVLLKELFEADQLNSVFAMIRAILIYTFGAELIGAALLWGLWPELPVGDRIFYCLFHSVAAFCNAGFALMPNNANFVGYGLRWQVWGVVAWLVIIGGIGFGVLNDLSKVFWQKLRQGRRPVFIKSPRNPSRLSLSTVIVLATTAILLVAGTIGIYLLEWNGIIGKLPVAEGISASWFQSVICRTAGFNTVDIGALQPSTKLFCIFLMFVGASPVSTGGGIKTASFALGALAFISILRGREQVELLGRTIPDSLIKRAFTIVGLSVIIVMTSTMALVIFENQQHLLIDYIFEATSAFGTVGLSTGISHKLTQPSLFCIILTMFIGRVGPLTLFIAVAGREVSARYRYPEERVTLG